MLFDQCHKMSRCIFFCKYNCLSAEGTYLCSTNIENVTVFCNIFHCHICIFYCKTISKTCSIKIQWNMVLLTDIRKLCEFATCIQCAILCWVRDVDHPRENHVFMIPITIKLIQIICHIFGLNLSFQLRKGQYFMTGGFNRTRLV